MLRGTLSAANKIIVAALIAGTAGMAVAAGGSIVPGMHVVDSAGHPVGIIAGTKGNNVILKTDKHEVTLPASSFTPDKGKLLFGMTEAQVDAAAEQASAQAQAAITPGANVYGNGGQLAGTIDSVGTDYVTIKLAGGQLVRVPRSGVAGSAKGVIVGATVAQLQQTASQAQPSASTSPEAQADTSGS